MRFLALAICLLVGCGKPEVPDSPTFEADFNRMMPRALEFRILAESERHQAIVDTARNQQRRETTEKKPWTAFVYGPPEVKKPVARWVTVADKALNEFASDRRIVTRVLPGEAGKPESLQVLIVIDPYHVTVNDMKSAQAGIDDQGGPTVFFQLTAAGGARFEKLTSNNLPQNGTHSQLGIIFSDILVSAPRINGTIGDSGQISGNFTIEETKEIAEILQVSYVTGPAK